MSDYVLGISGSPIPNSNTDRAVKSVLAHTGMETKFVKLSEYKLEPCRGCLGCKDTNVCVLKDDGNMLAEMFHAAKGFVIGGFTPYSSLDARTKAFMERMYCKRHQKALNAGKVGAAVITAACPPDNPNLPPAAETATSQIAFWMMEEGMNHVGTMVVLGNVPCIRCGYGDSCPATGIKMLFGPEATVESVGVNDVDQPQAQQQAQELGGKIRQALQ